MERLIPKNSKVDRRLFKFFNLTDMIILSVAFAIEILIILSDIPYKFIVVAIFAAFVVALFIGLGEDRLYRQIAYLARYIIQPKTYDGNRKSVDDLIPFKNIRENGIVVYPDYLGAIIEVDSIDFGLCDEIEQDAKISEFAEMFNNLGQSAVVQIIKIDRPIMYDNIADRLYARINAGGDDVKTEILKSRLQQIDTVNNVIPLYRPCYYIALFDTSEEGLLTQIDICRQGMDGAGLASKLLGALEVAKFFKYCYTRSFNERDFNELDISDYPEYVKPDSVKFGFNGFTVDGVQAFTMAVSDYPLYVNNAWGYEIFGTSGTKTVLTVKAVEKSKAIKRIDGAVVQSALRQVSKLSEIRDRETHVQTLDILQSNLQNENEMLFDCTLTVTAFNYDNEPNAAFRKNIRRKITRGKFGTSLLLGRQTDGFIKSTVARRPKLRGFERGINSESLAAVFPFVFSSIIDADGYYLGSDYYPVILDIWKRNDEFVNSNGVVFGKTGNGKSFFCKLLLSMVYSDNSKIFILDPENEYDTLAESVGGIFIDVGSATQGRINPLHVYPILTDEGEPAAPDVTFNSHLQFLENFFKLTLKGITSDAFEELNNLVKLAYESVGITQATDCTEIPPDKFPTFDTLLSVAEEQRQLEGLTPFKKLNLETVCTYIKKFASGGMYSNLWNGPSTLEVNSDLVVFNFQSLFGAKNEVVGNAQILVVMRYLDMQIINIRELNRNRRNNVLHPFILIDEGYNFIDKNYPVALNFVYQWYKRIRKYDGSIFFTTQDLNDVLGNPEVAAKTTAVVNNSQYSFILGLASANVDILAELYKNSGGLNETERYFITHAKRGQCFAICSPLKRARFNVQASDTVRELFDEKFNPEEYEDGDSTEET